MSPLWHWLGYWTGITDEQGAGYGFWSGIGSCLPEFAGLAVLWRHLSCHEASCWRLARHHVEGTPYRTCARHHPTVPARVTAAHIADAHQQATGSR